MSKVYNDFNFSAFTVNDSLTVNLKDSHEESSLHSKFGPLFRNLAPSMYFIYSVINNVNAEKVDLI